MLRKTQNLLLAATLLAGLVFCGSGALFGRGAQDGGNPQPSQGGTISKTDLQRLRWVEGAWRGSSCDGSLFYKRYHFEGDTRLIVETFSDEKLQKVTGVIRFELRNGRFARLGEGPSVAATEVGERSISFKASASDVYSYYWEYQSRDVWDVLAWTMGEGGKANVTTFRMQRWIEPTMGPGPSYLPYTCWSPSGLTTTWAKSTGAKVTSLTNAAVKAARISDGY